MDMITIIIIGAISAHHIIIQKASIWQLEVEGEEWEYGWSNNYSHTELTQ